MKITLETKAIEVAQELLRNGVQKAVFVCIDGEIKCSHPGAEFLQDSILTSKWDNHEALLIKVDEQTSCLFMVSIHSSVRGRPEGGVRILSSLNFLDALSDCQALSLGMTRKNAYAGIWEGGAKSVIVPFEDRIFQMLQEEKTRTDREIVGLFRELLWRNYGRFVSEMQGAFLVGEDVNLNSQDMQCLLKYCVHTSCLPTIVGGAGNPSPETAKGVFYAMKAACEKVFPDAPSIKGKTIIVKGVGQVGHALAVLLLDAGATLRIYDTSKDNISNFEKKYENDAEKRSRFQCEAFVTEFESAELDYLKRTSADIFSPNAKSATLTDAVIDALRESTVKLILGGENAQIANKDEKGVVNTLHQLGIVYVPETAVNYMGVFSAYQEHRGIVRGEFDTKAQELGQKTRNLFDEAAQKMIPPYSAFIEQARTAATAKEEAKEKNEVTSDRGIRIMEELLKNWAL